MEIVQEKDVMIPMIQELNETCFFANSGECSSMQRVSQGFCTATEHLLTHAVALTSAVLHRSHQHPASRDSSCLVA